MKTSQSLIIAVLFLLVSGCASTPTQYYPATSIVKFPEEGAVGRSELGDTLIGHSIRQEYDALVIEDSREYSVCLYKVRIQDQTAYAASLSPIGKPIFHANLQMSSIYTTGFVPAGYARIEESEKSATGFIFTPIVTGGCGGAQEFSNSYQRKKATKVDKPGFSQELIYNGRVGNYVKFIYREFSGDMARSAFTQEVQYDLDVSNFVGFKGVRIEIVEATNSEIIYKVVNHFRGS
jgi:hypothetical protein